MGTTGQESLIIFVLRAMAHFFVVKLLHLALVIAGLPLRSRVRCFYSVSSPGFSPTLLNEPTSGICKMLFCFIGVCPEMEEIL